MRIYAEGGCAYHDMICLCRIVNVKNGSIVIDGHDIRDVGLEVLRSRLALVPQDSTLFMGTLRENLYVDFVRPIPLNGRFLNEPCYRRDPQNTRTDAEIISALQRAWLLPRDGPVDAVTEAKFSLNASVSDEGDWLSPRPMVCCSSLIGSNYSAGEKQLLALCRALIKSSAIIVLVRVVACNENCH